MPPLRLGKQPPREDPRTLQLAKYLIPDRVLPNVKPFTPMVKTWPMYRNDQIGDCTIAAAGHMIQAWTRAAGREVDVTDREVLAAYEAVSGYDPATGQNDNGAVELDVLNYWRHTGIGNHRVVAFAQVNQADHREIIAASNLFGGLYAGAALPAALQVHPLRWHVTGKGASAQPGSWGGHAICLYAPSGRGWSVITWGARAPVSTTFVNRYFDELYAIVTEDFLHAGRSPAGLDLTALQADLARL